MYENKNWNVIHNLCMYFSKFLQVGSCLACDTLPIAECLFNQFSHKVLNLCVPAVQPYHNELGGEGEKKELSCLMIVGMAQIQDSVYEEFLSMILKY